MPTDPEWKYIHDAGDQFIKQFTDGVTLILGDLKKEIDISDIEKALSKGKPAIIIDSVDWEDSLDDKLLNSHKAVTDQIIAITGAEAISRLNIPMRFNIRNPYSERWISEHGAELVTQVSKETKLAIRSVVLDGFKSGKPPRQMASTIRNMVGLTDRDAKAVLRYWFALNEDATDLTAQRVDRIANTYSKRLLRNRALNIARTETINAANQGVINSWRIAKDNGFVLPETQKEWIAATASDRTCKHCKPMDSQKVGLDEDFYSKTLDKYVSAPTLHPSCRCAVGLVTPRLI